MGKTTLFRMIMGQEKPDNGSIVLGDTVKASYVDQSHGDLDPEKSVYERISGETHWLQVNGTSVNAKAYISKFNFGVLISKKK